MKKVLIFWYNFMYKFTEAILCFGMVLNQMKSVLHKYPNGMPFTLFFASRPLPRIQVFELKIYVRPSEFTDGLTYAGTILKETPLRSS